MQACLLNPENAKFKEAREVARSRLYHSCASPRFQKDPEREAAKRKVHGYPHRATLLI